MARSKDGVSAEYPVVAYPDGAAWEAWLDAQHAEAAGVWIRLAKKGSGVRSVTYAEALDVALCYGWIDGQKRAGDDRTWLQKFTPRGRRSLWSKVNREKVAALSAAGRMRSAGIAAVESARSDGRWDRAYDAQGSAVVPPDFQAALDADPRAREVFESATAGERYSFLFRVQTAVRPATRARRIAEFVEMLAAGRTLRSEGKGTRAAPSSKARPRGGGSG